MRLRRLAGRARARLQEPVAVRPLRALARAWRDLSPAGLLVSSFVVLIALGTLGLRWIPGLCVGGRIGWLDALFTMTSATCVTGLSVVDPATFFTRTGQLWILLFIQLGGLGLVTLGTFVIGALGRRLSLRSEMFLVPSVEITHRRDVRALARVTTRFVVGVELLGAAALFALLAPGMGAGEAAWHALFHSVSAFCNAGFSTFPGSLVSVADRPAVVLVVSALVVLGGVGFLSTEELARWWRAGGRRGRYRLSSHTWAALVTTALLLGLSAPLYALFEWDGVLERFDTAGRLANAWFMAATARTAGFNTFSYADLANPAAFLTVLLMFVGGSPGSMAGGVKTTTLAVVASLALARARARRHVVLHGRTVPPATVDRTVSLLLLAGTVLALSVFALSFTETAPTLQQERRAFLPLVFEATSAFATVGLSMDFTPTLSGAGRLVVVLLMFVGRVGPLAFFASVSTRSSEAPGMRPAREDVVVG